MAASPYQGDAGASGSVDGPRFRSDEIREYIDSFKASSDRARLSLYFVVVATVLVAIANNNIRDVSWPQRRLDALYADLRSGEAEGLRHKILREEYHKQFVAHGLLTSSPIPGVWIDANDLGLVGGVTLVLLMGLLVLSIAREHENLYLCLYRVRLLCREDPAHSRGDSAANLLYHALVMRQVLCFPPTLARWRPRWVLSTLLSLGFFVPFGVYGWILWTNSETVDEAAATDFGVDLEGLLRFQEGVAVALLALSVAAGVLSASMARRWRRAFNRVNPHRKYAPQMTIREWFGLRCSKDGPKSRAIARIVDELRVERDVQEECVPVQDQEVVIRKGHRIRVAKRDELAQYLRDRGEDAARKWCEEKNLDFRELRDFHPKESVNRDGRWIVRGWWTFYCGTKKVE